MLTKSQYRGLCGMRWVLGYFTIEEFNVDRIDWLSAVRLI